MLVVRSSDPPFPDPCVCVDLLRVQRKTIPILPPTPTPPPLLTTRCNDGVSLSLCVYISRMLLNDD
jgi:hypothetical protein